MIMYTIQFMYLVSNKVLRALHQHRETNIDVSIDLGIGASL